MQSGIQNPDPEANPVYNFWNPVESRIRYILNVSAESFWSTHKLTCLHVWSKHAQLADGSIIWPRGISATLYSDLIIPCQPDWIITRGMDFGSKCCMTNSRSAMRVQRPTPGCVSSKVSDQAACETPCMDCWPAFQTVLIYNCNLQNVWRNSV